MATAVSPRIVSGVTRSDNHGTRKFSKPRSKLPEIVKRGPINNRNNSKKIVGLSLQKTEEPKKFVRKRGSLESNRKGPPRSNARNAILKAQHLEIPNKKQPVIKGMPYKMPKRQASVPPRTTQ